MTLTGAGIMAERKDIDFSYTLTDRVIRLALGELADFSGAKYDGDFSLTLEEAQRRKHEYVAEQIGIEAGKRVLDLGCGWGGLLNYIRGVGATGLGVTLSSAQLESCRRHGLDVQLRDAREVTRETFGEFDAVASLGAFEHFCSPEDYEAGRQDEVYHKLFENIATVLPVGGRFYLQTMVFGRNMIPVEQVDRHAPRESDAWYLAMMAAAFPGSRSARSRWFGAPSRASASSRASAAGSTTSRRSSSGTSAPKRGTPAWRCSSSG
jgi:cyclopropane-fatty-acyl-phospholipid synthase